MEDQHICKFDLLTVVQKYFEGVLLSSITIYDMPIAYQEDTDDYNDTKGNLGALPHCGFFKWLFAMVGLVAKKLVYSSQ